MATAEISYKTYNTNVIIPEILDQLLLQWTPVMQHIVTVNQVSGAQVKTKIQRITGTNRRAAIN